MKFAEKSEKIIENGIFRNKTLIHSDKTTPLDILEVQYFMPNGLIISEKAFRIIIKNKVSNYWSFPITIEYKSKKLNYFFIATITDYTKIINFNLTKHRVFTTLKNKENYDFMDLIQHEQNPNVILDLKPDKTEIIHLTETISEDIFNFRRFLFDKYFVSEKLKIELESECIGFTFNSSIDFSATL